MRLYYCCVSLSLECDVCGGSTCAGSCDCVEPYAAIQRVYEGEHVDCAIDIEQIRRWGEPEEIAIAERLL